jgi:Bacterial Ig domain
MMFISHLAPAADANGNGVPDNWELAHPGVFSVWPPALNQTLLPYNTAPRPFLLNNDTPATVTYTATLANDTVPLYSAVDSITGGVTYAWDQISVTGTLLPTISNADDVSEPVAITGFAFPFYGTNYSQVHVSSNGLLSFGYGNSSGGNDQIPGPSAPQNTIAAFWDDLDTRTTGAIYYKQEATCLIIEFQSVGRYGGGAGNYTFQAVLHSTGKVELRYKTMTGILNSALIGVEGADQTYGFGVVNNAAYVADSLALRFDPTSKFFNIATLAGSVPANTVGSLNGLFNSLSLPPGAYIANVSISHTGAGPSPLALTAPLTVPDQPGAISITSPTTGSTAMQGTWVQIETPATDPDGFEKVEFYDGTTKLGETPAYPGYDYQSFYWYVAGNGSRSISAKAIDFFGGETLSAPLLFNATANNDFDGMPDSWEIANYTTRPYIWTRTIPTTVRSMPIPTAIRTWRNTNLELIHSSLRTPTSTECRTVGSITTAQISISRTAGWIPTTTASPISRNTGMAQIPGASTPTATFCRIFTRSRTGSIRWSPPAATMGIRMD